MSKTGMLMALWALLATAACAQDGTRPVKVAPPTRLPEPVAAAAPEGVPVSVATVPRDVRRAVVADAARRFAVAENAVVIAAAEQVTWNDGSLGCAEPGGMYTQALVPGYRITARTQSGALLYHTDAHGQVRQCARFQPGQKSLPPKPPGSGAEPRTDPAAPPDR
jgi:hypothetical protein